MGWFLKEKRIKENIYKLEFKNVLKDTNNLFAGEKYKCDGNNVGKVLKTENSE